MPRRRLSTLPVFLGPNRATFEESDRRGLGSCAMPLFLYHFSIPYGYPPLARVVPLPKICSVLTFAATRVGKAHPKISLVKPNCLIRPSDNISTLFNAEITQGWRAVITTVLPRSRIWRATSATICSASGQLKSDRSGSSITTSAGLQTNARASPICCICPWVNEDPPPPRTTLIYPSGRAITAW